MTTRWVRLAVVALLLTPVATAQAPWVFEGGEPGVHVVAGGVPIADATAPARAIPVDPDTPLELEIRVSPTGEETWDIRAIRVGLLVNGPDSAPPAALARRTDSETELPPGWTSVMNRTVDLGAMKHLGAGTFLAKVEILDANDEQLDSAEFYVRVPATFSTLFTAQGALLAALSVAAGYGLWQILRDIKEVRDAWIRHRRSRERARLDVLGRAEENIERVVAKAGAPLARAVEIYDSMGDEEHDIGVFRWSATGIGLGGVTVSWLQYLGYVALDSTFLLVTALEAGAALLLVALVTKALLRRRANAAHKSP